MREGTYASDGVDTLLLEGISLVDEPRQVLQAAGRGKGTGHSKQNDLLALAQLLDGHLLLCRTREEEGG